MDEASIRAEKLPIKRTATHLYFYGWEGPDPEVCLQQFYLTSFTDKQLVGAPTFKTTEHYMMYRKAILFGDQGTANKILAAETPAEAKALGRETGPFDKQKWETSCDGIVEQGNYLKFSQNPQIRDILLNTGELILVEASPSDRIWGIGFDAENAEGNEEEWGKNKLGNALMKVRERLRSIRL